MENEPKEFLNVEEAALLLKIPPSTVYKLAKQGKIPSRKVGKHWRFHYDTLLKWISGEAQLNDIEVQGGKEN